MNIPIQTSKTADDVYSFRTWEPSPYGFISVSSHLILGSEPILVDTQMPIVRSQFFEAAFGLVDPKDVRWIFLTHDDRDHSHNLPQLLELCPRATFLTDFVAIARMSEEFDLPMDRVRLIRPGERWEANGGSYGIIRPPVYDSPSTVALFDSRRSVLFSSDCFGAFCSKVVDEIGDLPPDEHAHGFSLFQTANSPWCHLLPGTKQLADVTAAIRDLAPRTVLTGHGPSAVGKIDRLLDLVAQAAAGPPFPAPSHEEFEALMAKMAG